MVAVRVIPCLDVDGGRVVKGVKFADLKDAGDPVELARRYGESGADELTFLDVTASSGDRETVHDVVRACAEEVFIPLTVGGGVRSVDDVDRLLRDGADKVSVNTSAVKNRSSSARSPDTSATRSSSCPSTRAGPRGRARNPDSKSPPAAAAKARAAAPSTGSAKPPTAGSAKSCSTPSTPTAHARDSTSNSSGPPAPPWTCRSSPRAEPARSNTSPRRWKPEPTRCWPPASSTSAH